MRLFQVTFATSLPIAPQPQLLARSSKSLGFSGSSLMFPKGYRLSSVASKNKPAKAVFSVGIPMSIAIQVNLLQMTI